MPFGRKKSLMDRAHDYVEQLSDTVLPQLEQAWEQAVDKAGPALADARDKATPLIAEGKALAAEKASAGAALAAERASTSRDLAAAKVAELRGQEPETKRGKLKKVLLLGGLLAIGGAVLAKLRSRQDESAHWQSSYTPPAPPAPAATPTPAAAAAPVTPATTGGDPLTDPLPDEEVTADDVVTVEPPAPDDIGGGAPGEAISDSVEEAHEATTPDEPAEIIDIDDVPKKD